MGAMDVAVKQLQTGASEVENIKFLQEAAINGQFRHPNVVQLMGVVTDEGPVSEKVYDFIPISIDDLTFADTDSVGASFQW